MKLLALVLALAPIACGPSKESDDDKNRENLVGTWASPACVKAVDSDEAGTYRFFKDTAVFTETTLTYTQTEFADETCALRLTTMTLAGTYKTGSATESPQTALEGATNLDLTIGYFTFAVHDQATLASYLQDGATICGTKPALNQAVDVGVASCDGAFGYKNGGMLYTIYKASKTELLLGDDDRNADTPASRPTKLDLSALVKV